MSSRRMLPKRLKDHEMASAEQYNALMREYDAQTKRLAEAMQGHDDLIDDAEKYRAKSTKLEYMLKTATVHRGRNKIKKKNFDGNDHTNQNVIADYLAWSIFPHHKFLDPSWSDYSPDDRGSFFCKILGQLSFPAGVPMEVYWSQGPVPLINKKMCEWRSNLNTTLKKSFLGNMPPCFFCSSFMIIISIRLLLLFFLADMKDTTLQGGDGTPRGYITEMLELVAEPPKDIEDEETLEPIFHFIVNYVARLYGMRNIQKRLLTEKGTTLITLLTTSDIAYAYSVCINQEPVWMKWNEISCLDKEEQDKWRNSKNLPASEKANYKMKEKPLFTAREGRKLGYLGHGWSEEGVNLYSTVSKKWKALYRSKDWWDAFEVAWENYVESTGVCKYWKEKSDDEEAHQGQVDVATRELPANRFACPGDEGFEDDRPWMVNGTRGEEEDLADASDDDEDGPIMSQPKRRKVSVSPTGNHRDRDDE